MRIAYKIISLTLLFNAAHSANSQTLGQINELANPYRAKLQSNDSPAEGSSEFIQLGALSDRFEYCQTDGINTVVAMSRHIAVMADAGFPVTLAAAEEYMAKRLNLGYPFNPDEIAEIATNRIDLLAIKLGGQNPGNSDTHFDKLATTFWQQCTNLPLAPFEDEWRELDDV